MSNISNIPKGLERRIIPVLLSEGLVDASGLERARTYAAKQGITITDALAHLKLVSQEDLMAAFGTALGTTVITLKGFQPDPEVLALVPESMARDYKAFPISRAGDTLTLAMANPLDINALDTIGRSTGLEVVAVVARGQELEDAVNLHYRKDETLDEVTRRLDAMYQAQPAADTVEISEDVTEDSPPIVRLVDKMIRDAVKARASDIHVEPGPQRLLVRVRVDGVLRDLLSAPEGACRAIVSRIKVMANLDIAERRLPQDGRIAFGRFNRNYPQIDLRVSSIPTVEGEKVVMRIINRADVKKGLESLGMSRKVLDAYRRAIHTPYGLVLHVGPTGSGKTTTLYAALAEVSHPGINVLTVEDPVEYRLPGISQTQVHPDIGLTFARSLRAFLRQDPDVIMVGEMRDTETALIAVEAALTGHLVLSTLHTNDAVGTITRLGEMGLEPFLVGSSLLAVCAQRLMRRLCDCKKETPPDAAHAAAFKAAGIKEAAAGVFRAAGCEGCGGTGYSGRIGIHELLEVTDNIRRMIIRGADEPALLEAARAAGMLTLYEDAMRKVALGISSLEEALRVVRSGEFAG